jgi:ABC-type transport system involved in multi-copper enzyme maturation permease subunit
MLRIRLPRLQIIGRELIEIAARQRTYAIRALYILAALVTLGLAINAYDVQHGASAAGAYGSAQAVGHGMELILPVLLAMTGAMALLLPTMAAVSVAQEREQGTLQLLLLTTVSPTSLLLQKYCSLLIVSTSISILSLPLLAVGYALGGLDAAALLHVMIFVGVLVTQLAAIGLAAGCIVRGSVAAILLANGAAAAQVVPPFLIADHMNMPWCLRSSPLVIADLSSFPDAALIGPPIALTVAMLAIARIGITRHASVAEASLLGRLFRQLDGVLERFDARWFRRRFARDLPGSRPLLWLESSRASFCSWRYLARLMLPALAVLLPLMSVLDQHGMFRQAQEILFLALCAALVLITVVFTGVVNRERRDQTLDVLLSTDLTPAAILSEKTRALSRLRWCVTGVLLAAIWIIPLADAYDHHYYYYTDEGWVYFATKDLIKYSVETVLVLGIGSWLAVLIGLRFRSYRSALIIALVVLVVWMLSAPALYYMFWSHELESALRYDEDAGMGAQALPIALLCLGSAASPIHVFFKHGMDGMGTTHLVVGWAIDAVAWVALRRLCLWRAPRWMSAATRARA